MPCLSVCVCIKATDQTSTLQESESKVKRDIKIIGKHHYNNQIHHTNQWQQQ